ncbi:MAG: M61 family metallopeptidase [Flavobacteriaceae bacterium]|nr:M61 family metallopeptidase [Flavobacteriaceae bacterium]
MKNFLFVLSLLITTSSIAQTLTKYEISFDNAIHHEAVVTAEFDNVEDKVLELLMSRSSPGRYALHEFAKNVYNVKAFDSKGNRLTVTRPDPYQWNVSGHDGTVKVSYTLFANRGDGTYSQVDETHAHLNIPATFMFAKGYTQRPIEVTFAVRDDLHWKVATQLKHLEGNTYYAPDMQYFMDSPTEISNYSERSFAVASNGKKHTINFVLHHKGTEQELDGYFEKVKKIVLQEMNVYGELPDYDFGDYTFLVCYMPNVAGDGMEHRNSTSITGTRSLANGGMEKNIGTVSHEYFHSWNVERIRPMSLEPFDFERVNMSGELWFAEGFTSYYSDLILCRAGIISQEEYIDNLASELNYVWNSPARNYFDPVEMSDHAPFVDAARSVDPVNWENTFISYYSYGSVLGLALDLSLRNLDGNRNLDDFMKIVWKTYGKTGIPYTVKDLEFLLNEYAGNGFGTNFFNDYIFDSKMPDYKSLLASVGVAFDQLHTNEAYLGVHLNFNSGRCFVSSNPFEGGPAYMAGLDKGDELIAIDDKLFSGALNVEEFLSQFTPGQTVKVIFKRFGETKETALTFGADPSYTTSINEKAAKKESNKRNSWLAPR